MFWKSEEQSGEGKSVLAALPEGNIEKKEGIRIGLKFIHRQRPASSRGEAERD
jgi:hypothetical protein